MRRVLWAAATSAAITGLIALLLGGVLARTLTRPVRELTDATQAIASGALQQQVTVRSHDEIGQLANSFNKMSSDLARSSQLRKQMTADLAHDLRTPLAILRGYIEGLKEERIQATPTLFALLNDEVMHLQRMIEDLRVLSLADAGELPLNTRLVDPAALLERAGLAHMVPAIERSIALRVEAAENMPSIAVDTDRMAQVLNNLVANALRHTQQGEIVLAAAVDNQQVRLSVRDTGSGIAPEDLPFVFDRFYRGDKARQRSDGDSSGLGLAIAKAIVEAHGGSLSAQSTPGQGSTFVATLPVAQAQT
jgi:two-component system sensor histidine kinase BaeS